MSPSISRTSLRDLVVASRRSGSSCTRIDTLSGGIAAGGAAIQALTLPVLILGWGLAVAAVTAFT